MALRSALLFTVLSCEHCETACVVEEVVKKFPLLFKKNMKKLHPGLDYFDKIGCAGSECPQGPTYISEEDC